MPNAFVEAGAATDIYLLQKEGIFIAKNQQEITPFQRQVLVQEKIRQNKEEEKELNKSNNSPPSRRTPNARSGRINAIKESQQERDRFVNKKLVDDK